MRNWDLQTTSQKSESKKHLKYNIIFKFMIPTQIVYHFQKTKNTLLSKLFTNNAISFHTSTDYYLDTSTANLALKQQINHILSCIGKKEYYCQEEYEKIKNMFVFAGEDGVERLPWFLK